MEQIDFIKGWLRTNGEFTNDGKDITYNCVDIENMLKEALIIDGVSKCRRVEFTNDTFLKEGIYEVETNLGRKFEAMYSLNRWFEHKIDIQDGEKVVAYFC